MQHSETVGDALRALVSHLSVQDRVAVPSLTTSGGTVLLSIAVYQPAAACADQISDGALAAIVNALRSLCGCDWSPAEVLVPRTPPAARDPYWRHFRAPVRFNQESATLVFPARDLERRIAGADPMMRALLEERIGHLKGRPGCEFSDDVRRLLRTRLTSHRCSADDIAELLAMHRRTLSRHLKGNGLGYRAITNEIRFEIARQLLQDTQASLAQISAALGYSEASAFARAFRRWSGQTPTAWRSHGDTADMPTAQTRQGIVPSGRLKHASGGDDRSAAPAMSDRQKETVP
jgi:AraC-like DNA-binding protein